jgi:hypothetical protein
MEPAKRRKFGVCESAPQWISDLVLSRKRRCRVEGLFSTLQTVRHEREHPSGRVFGASQDEFVGVPQPGHWLELGEGLGGRLGVREHKIGRGDYVVDRNVRQTAD